MNLLLCAATELEIRPTIEFINCHNKNIGILITGIGLTAATHQLTRSVLKQKPDFIIQAGIAGCIDLQLPLGKIVIVAEEVIGDLGVKENGQFKSLFNVGLVNRNEFPWKNGRLSNNMDSLKKTGLTIVNGVTVNEISTDPEKINFYKEELNAGIETMEGAALHYVALMENIPFLQIRSLSNFAGERDKSKWVMDFAIAGLNVELQKILSKF